MKNHWTGGQYSLYRGLLGLFVLMHFIGLVNPFSGGAPPTPPLVSGLVIGFSLIAVMPFVLGYNDRIQAVFIGAAWYISTFPIIGPETLIASILLLVHIIMPGSPFGSWPARGRTDPRGRWRFPDRLYAFTWIVGIIIHLSLGAAWLSAPKWVDGPPLIFSVQAYGFSGSGSMWSSTALYVSAFHLLFGALSIFSLLRPWLWVMMSLFQLVGLFLFGDTELSAAFLMLQVILFEPGWLRSPSGIKAETLFYDGGCGLCHRAIRFFLAEDQYNAFQYAPLESNAFEKVPNKPATLPDSIVLLTRRGQLLTLSDAVVHALKRLGGYWRIVGTMLGWIPRPLRDTGYRFIASIRHRLFNKPKDVCPIMPADLRTRFIFD